MPADAPRSKLEAVRGYGSEVVLHADRATLFDRLREVERERGGTFVHPFDDPVGLAGAGTVGLEIVEQVAEAACVVVPVGGGGLMAGVASAVKQVAPSCRVVAVELAAGPGLGPALAAGKPVPVPRPADTLADGMTPPFVGALPLAVALTCVDEIVTVTEAEIVEAMAMLLTRAKLYVEGSGAAATAALLAGKVRLPRGARTVAIVSGGNVDIGRLLAAVAARAGEKAPVCPGVAAAGPTTRAQGPAVRTPRRAPRRERVALRRRAVGWVAALATRRARRAAVRREREALRPPGAPPSSWSLLRSR
jgi:threonine dehydratase